ncbi:MAG: alpha/beta fold hydrolase [Betaproteobacteria bacterium]|nr:alpha/beta fold hydrolase [Betaproteobacteria bacterium]
MKPLQFTLTCLALFAGVVMFQDSLLYFPDRAAVADMVSPGLRAWPTPQDFRGLVAEPAAPARATAVVFHGNAGHAGHRSYYAQALTRLGLRVILAEYPGYGPRDGETSERSLVADADQTVALAHGRYGPPLLLVGESLGAAVATAVSARQGDSIAAMLLITPWDRLENVAAHHYPWLPVRWFLRDRYDNTAHLASFGGPVLVAVAERDSIVPARFGVALHAAAAHPKRLAVMKGADHNDWIDHVDDAWWREAIDFLLGESRPSRSR